MGFDTRDLRVWGSKSFMSIIGVTGATGAVGGRVAERLAAKGIEQRLIVRDPDRAPKLDGAEVVQGGSYPPGFHGWHRKTRQVPFARPRTSPYFRRAPTM